MRGQEMDGIKSGGTSKHEEVHLQPAGGFMMAQVLYIKLKCTQTHIHSQDNSKYLPHVPPLEGTFISCKLFLILTKPWFLMDLPFFYLSHCGKSQ